jgi:AraC-like DNA-binding protein
MNPFTSPDHHMTALRRPDEPTAASYSERIAQLVAALGPHIAPSLDGVRLLDAASWDAWPGCGAACIYILCGHARHAPHVDGTPVPFHPCYRVHTGLTLLEPLTWEQSNAPTACLSIQLDLQVAAELILTLDEVQPYSPSACSTQSWLALDDGMADSVVRLLQALPRTADARVLGPGIVRELVYRVLTGPQGGAVRSALAYQGSMRRIGKVLRRIRASYSEAVDVAALASEAGMSIAAFHAHFKAVTNTTPIQFLKNTRLQQARLFMMREGIGAAHVSQLVGYESNSQFSREFKRLFGRTPTQEAIRMKAAHCPAEIESAAHAVQAATYKDFPSFIKPRPYLS